PTSKRPGHSRRHRHHACIETNAETFFEEFTDPGSVYDYVISENLQGRDLTPAQRIDVSTKLIEIMRARARRRQKLGEQLGGPMLRVNLLRASPTTSSHSATAPRSATRSPRLPASARRPPPRNDF